MVSVEELIRSHLADHASSWAVSCYGAAAEFHWVPGERALVEDVDHFTVATTRGALSIRPRGRERPVAYETLSARKHRWNHGVAICARASEDAGARRRTLAELGPDTEAVLPEHRRARLFDLGLGARNLDACVRTDDEALASELRRCEGRSVLDGAADTLDAIREASPHRVFLSALARIEVYQPIPPPGEEGTTPEGPHTHLLPELLARRRTHAAIVPIPRGWLPVLALYPPSAVADAHGLDRVYDTDAHAHFESLLERWGDAVHVREKRRARAAIAAGTPAGEYSPPDTRAGRLALRLAVRQYAVSSPDTPGMRAWQARFDPLDRRRHRAQGR